jgi:hypothetical protein
MYLYRLVDEQRRPVALVQAETGRQARAEFLAEQLCRLGPLCPEQRLQADAELARLGRRLEPQRWT